MEGDKFPKYNIRRQIGILMSKEEIFGESMGGEEKKQTLSQGHGTNIMEHSLKLLI